MIKDYIIKSRLGIGSYGTVYKVCKKNINVKYVAVVKPTNCDDNSSVSISTNAGTPTRKDGIMETYTLTTTNSSININVIRESDKSKVLYAKDCSFSSEAELDAPLATIAA